MKKLIILFLFASFFTMRIEAQNQDLSKDIIGDWVFQYGKVYELIVDNENVKDSIVANIAKTKELLAGQELIYTEDSVLWIIDDHKISQGTYRIEGNVETLTFDGYIYQDTISIEGDTLRINFGNKEFYQNEGYRLYPDEDNYEISNVTTSYIYTRKKMIEDESNNNIISADSLFNKILFDGSKDQDFGKKILGQWQFVTTSYDDKVDCLEFSKEELDKIISEANEKNKNLILHFDENGHFSDSDGGSAEFSIYDDVLNIETNPTATRFFVTIHKNKLFLNLYYYPYIKFEFKSI